MALLLDLVVVTPDGDPRQALRKRRRMDALLAGHGAERRKLIDELSNRRLLVTRSEWDPDVQRDVQIVDLIHEALIANWSHLRDEIVDQCSLLQRRLRFELAVNDWKSAGKSDQYLLRHVQLKEGKRLRQDGDVALQTADGANLLSRSIEAENGRLRRQRRAAVALSAVLILLAVAALGAAAFAFDRQQQAEVAQATAQAQATRADQALIVAEDKTILAGQAQATAEAETRRAKSGELAALALREIDQDPDLSILLALEAISTILTDSAENALRSALQADNLQAILPHSGTVSAVSFSPDGKRLITGDDRVLRIWDTASHQLLDTWRNHNSVTSKIAYQPQGTQVATANYSTDADNNPIDVAIRLWDPNTGKILHELPGHTNLIYGLEYSADGTQLASASWDGTIRVWDVRTGKSFNLAASSPIWDVAFSPNGRTMATAGNDGKALLWDLSTRRVIETHESKQPVFAVAYGPDGNLWATAGNDLRVRLWRRNNADRPAATLVGHTDSILDIDFSADGKRLVSTGAEGKALIWDVSNLDAGSPLVMKLSGHQGRLWVAQYDPSGTLVATGGDDETVRLWSAGAHSAPINALAFGPASSSLLATASLDNTARIWHFAGGTLSLVQTLNHNDGVLEAIFSPDGQIVATVSSDHGVRLWDPRSGQLLRSLTGHIGVVGRVDFSPDGALVATGSDDKTIRIWDTASGTPLITLEGSAYAVNDIDFSPDGARVASVSDAGQDGGPAQVRLWRLADHSFKVVTEDAKDLERIAFSPDGTLLAFAGANGVVTVWDILTSRSVYTQTMHNARIFGLAFDKTGKRLATTGSDGSVLISNTRTGERLKDLPRADFEVNSVDFSPDGKYLVTSGSSGLLYVQALTVADLQQQASQQLTREWLLAECERLLQSGCPPKPGAAAP